MGVSAGERMRGIALETCVDVDEGDMAASKDDMSEVQRGAEVPTEM